MKYLFKLGNEEFIFAIECINRSKTVPLIDILWSEYKKKNVVHEDSSWCFATYNRPATGEKARVKRFEGFGKHELFQLVTRIKIVKE